MTDIEKHDALTALEDRVYVVLKALEEANKEGSPLRCRDLSVTITHIEDGLFRLDQLRIKALKKL